jgi:hypothetical protein
VGAQDRPGTERSAAGEERAMTPSPEREPLPTSPIVGYHSGNTSEDLGAWIIQIPGGPAFAFNAVAVLSRAAAERAPGPSRDVFEQIRDAFIEASPDYGDADG